MVRIVLDPAVDDLVEGGEPDAVMAGHALDELLVAHQVVRLADRLRVDTELTTVFSTRGNGASLTLGDVSPWALPRYVRAARTSLSSLREAVSAPA